MNDKIKKSKKKAQSKEEVKKLFVTLELDKPRELRYGFKALKKLEEHFEAPVIKLLTLLQTKVEDESLTTDDVLVLIWVGLIKDDPSLTKDQLEKIVDESDYSLFDLIDKFQQGFGSSMPEMDAADLAERVAKLEKKVKLTLPSQKTGSGRKSSKRQ